MAFVFEKMMELTTGAARCVRLGWGTGTGSPRGRGRDGAADKWAPVQETVVYFAFEREIVRSGDFWTIRSAAVPA
jgi:hypothetical protein